MVTDEYVYPTKRGQLIWLVVFVAAGCYLFFVEPIASSYEIWLRSFKDVATLEFIIRAQAVIQVALFVLIAVFWVGVGTKILRARRFPPKGWPVVFRTKVRRGRIVVLEAVLSYVLSAASLAVAVQFAYWGWEAWTI